MQYSYLIDSVNIKRVEEKNNTGVFHIEGLYTGYGTTMGNSLRRVLISSLPGAAISQVKVKGVKHEFSTIPGMNEDVVEFVLNLKQVRFKFYADEPQVLKLKVKGQKDVTAGDIESTALVEILNKDLPLATLSSKTAELDMELVVEKGLGYEPVESRHAERLPIGTIMLDCIFSPVEHVQFEVENMRVGDRTDYDRLKLTIQTDGSITPTSALRKAANIMRDHFIKISEFAGGEEAEEKELEEENKKKTPDTKKKSSTAKTTKKK